MTNPLFSGWLNPEIISRIITLLITVSTEFGTEFVNLLQLCDVQKRSLDEVENFSLQLYNV